MDQLETHYKL